MKLDIKVSGLEKMQGDFATRSRKIKEATEIIIKKSLLLIERFTKIESPVRTGRLRASITEGIELHKTYAVIGPTVFYAKFVHVKNPFMFRGTKYALPEIKDMIKNEVKTALNV